MEKKSLTEVMEATIKVIKELEINDIDKLELMINLNKLLDENNYERDIKVLRKEHKEDL